VCETDIGADRAEKSDVTKVTGPGVATSEQVWRGRLERTAEGRGGRPIRVPFPRGLLGARQWGHGGRPDTLRLTGRKRRLRKNFYHRIKGPIEVAVGGRPLRGNPS